LKRKKLGKAIDRGVHTGKSGSACSKTDGERRTQACSNDNLAPQGEKALEERGKRRWDGQKTKWNGEPLVSFLGSNLNWSHALVGMIRALARSCQLPVPGALSAGARAIYGTGLQLPCRTIS